MRVLLLLLAGLNAQDPVRVNARLADYEIRAGETTILRVDVETDGPRAQIDRITSLPPGIELVSTRDFDQRQFSLPGGTRRFVSREFVLRARAQGQYRIPSIDVVVGGARYSTRSMLLVVDAPAPRLRGEESEGPTGEVVLRAWVDSDTVFVGEQVTLQADALFSQSARLRLRRAPEYEPPSPSGFWIQDLPDRRNPTTRTVDGGIYEVQSFRRAFFPLSPGEFTIPPARLEYEMRRGLLYAPETFEVVTDEIPVVVLPVPAAGQPASFTGAVGDYTMRGWLAPTEVPAGEAVVLTVEVEGVGNVKALPPPTLPEMPGIEAFPPGEASETEIVGDEIRGRKQFTWVLIPRDAGEREIPAIRYAYFDPGAGGYETLEVPPMTLRVTPGAVADDVAPSPTLRYLKVRPQGESALRWVDTRWFGLAQLAPLLLLAGALLVRRRRRRGPALSRGALRRRRRALLRDLEDRIEHGDDGFFAEAETKARAWTADRLGLPPRHAARRDALRGRGVDGPTAAALAALFDRLAAARYAPTPPGRARRREMLLALGELLDRVDRKAPQPPPGAGGATEAAEGRGSGGAGGAGGSGGAAVGVSDGAGEGAGGARAGGAAVTLLLAVAALAAPAGAQQEEGVGDGARGHAAQDVSTAPSGEESFRAGIAAFDGGRFAAAASAFDRYVTTRPGDPAGWYNLGTAYQRAGHPGYAIWAWLHVTRLDPRDDDTRHNLRVAGAAPELVTRVSPPLPLRREELLLLASVAWALGALGLAWWVLRRRRWTAAVGAAGVLVALALAAAALSTRGDETLIVLDPAALRAGPTLGGDVLAELVPGAGLEPVTRHGDWVRVRTLHGREGWVEARSTGSL